MMTTKKDTKPQKPDLVALYRPLGLKAVLAASLMLKKSPQKKIA